MTIKNKELTIIINIILAVWVLGALALVLSGCNGCNKPVYIAPDPVTVIEQTHNPAIDSFKQVTALLKDSIVNLNKELVKQKNKTSIAESKATATSKRLQEALDKQDTSGIIVYADDIIEEFHNYIQETNRQDSIQDATIEKQAATIINNRAEIELHESKYRMVKIAYEVKSIEASDFAKENKKLQRKLQRAKFWNKVFGIGTAAGVALAGIVFL